VDTRRPRGKFSKSSMGSQIRDVSAVVCREWSIAKLQIDVFKIEHKTRSQFE
jgi:hypothetical protein